MKNHFFIIFLVCLFTIASHAQIEIPISITTRIDVDLDNKIFKAGNINGKGPFQYYDMDLKPITNVPDLSTYQLLYRSWYPIDLSSSYVDTQKAPPEMKGQFLINSKIYGRYNSNNEVIGSYTVQYYSETELISSVKAMSVVYSSYSSDRELLVRKIYPLPFIMRGTFSYISTSEFFIENCTYVDENTYFVDLFSGDCLLLDENFEVKLKTKWGAEPNPELPKEYVYLFEKWEQRITENPKLLRRFSDGPKNRFAKSSSINYSVYHIWGEVYVRVRWFSEFYFVKI